MRLETQRILLTGATGGIGTELALKLGARGSALLLTGRDREKLGALCDSLRGLGAVAETVPADLTTVAGRSKVRDAANEFGGGITGLINNAGVNHYSPFESLSAERVRAILEVNAVAPMLLTHELLPVLRRSANAVILNVGSILGSIGMPGQAAYSSSKFAMHGFSEALRRELHGSGIRVLYVAPRSTDTAMNDAHMRAMNEATGATTDLPCAVANQVVESLESLRDERFLGWPERLFVRINALLPQLVDRSLQNRADIARFARTETTLLDGAES